MNTNKKTNKVFNKSDIENTIDIISYLSEDGIDAYNTGGTSIEQNDSNNVQKLTGSQYKVNTQNDSYFLTVSPNTFLKTLDAVEKQFKYDLFG